MTAGDPIPRRILRPAAALLRALARRSRWRRRWNSRQFEVWSGCWASGLFHMVLFVVLGLASAISEQRSFGPRLTVLAGEAPEEVLLAADEVLVAVSDRWDVLNPSLTTTHAWTAAPVAPGIGVPLADSDAAPGEPSGGGFSGLDGTRGHAADPLADRPADVLGGLPADVFRPSGLPTGGGFEGRSPEARGRLGSRRGATPQSEDAVARGLTWLAAHQSDDGGWRFDLDGSLCRGLCGNPGTAGSTTAATGLALLPFLGAGAVTEESPFKRNVDRGLYYLTTHLLVTPHGGDLQEGTMYGQGLAAIALCEAYAMTRDASLQTPAQWAVDFIGHAQHPAGGWRYAPGQPGDTTVLGWQLMALKSARLAGLQVPQAVIERAAAFLNAVQSESGAYYGYMTPGQQPGPTAIGLLCRMYQGWSRYDQRLAQGVQYLEQLGPSRNDMYFNYYATQVLHHYQGNGWNKWNEATREHLITTQSRQGHEHGSWYFADKHGRQGGRLYTTAMCLMILEVYYRHMPLYGEQAVGRPDRNQSALPRGRTSTPKSRQPRRVMGSGLDI